MKHDTFSKDFWLYLLVFISIIAIICFFPSWFTKSGAFDFKDTGQIGDTIGGIMGPFVAIAAAILTFLAFWVQYKANEQQKKDIDNERMENIFFKMYEEHIRLCESINIPAVGQNKRALHFIFYEIQTLTILLNYYFKIFIKDESIRTKLMQKTIFISFSLVLSGVTRKSNYNLTNKLNLLFKNDRDVMNYLNSKAGDSSFKNNNILTKIFDFVGCLQSIKKEDLIVLQHKNDLILFNDYADKQLNQNLNIPWFTGHRPDLVRYFKSLGNMLNFIRNNEHMKNKNKLHTLFDFMFSHMSEHEIGIVLIFSDSTHEFNQILGELSFENSISTTNKSEQPIEDKYEEQVKNYTYPEVKRGSQCYKENYRDFSHKYEWDKQEESINHKNNKNTDEILKGVIMNWILRTNSIYNYKNNNKNDYNDEEIYNTVKKIGETPFEKYIQRTPSIILLSSFLYPIILIGLTIM